MTEPTDTKLDPLHNPAVWFSALLLVFPLLLLIDMFYVHPTSYDGNLRTQIVTGVLAVIMMVGGYWLGTVANGAQKKPDQPPVPPPAVPPAQGGFFVWSLMPWIVLLAVGAAMLTGCTTSTASMYAGLATQAKAGIQVFDDNSLATMHDLLCAQPYAAIQRHPEMQPGIVALCGPLVNTASLDPAQVAQMLSIAKQLGILPAPAASVPK